MSLGVIFTLVIREIFPAEFNRLILSRSTEKRKKGVLLLFSEGHGDGHGEDLIHLDLWRHSVDHFSLLFNFLCALTRHRCGSNINHCKINYSRPPPSPTRV